MNRISAVLSGPVAARSARFAFVVLLFVLPFVQPPDRNFQLTMVFVYSVAILGLTVLTGASGQISLAQATFLGIGAYCAGVTTVVWKWPLWAGLVAAAVVPFVVGYLVGVLAARLNGLYLALVTVTIAIVFIPLVKRFDGLTGGANGLVVPQPQPPAGLGLATDQWHYLIVLVLTLACWRIGRGILGGRVGRALYASQDNALVAVAMGVDVPFVKATAFAWCGGLAGVAGGMYVIAVGFLSPESFSLLLSVGLLAGMAVGGVGRAAGAVLGAVYIQFVPVYTQEISSSLAGIIYGASLILVILLLPGGLASVPRLLRVDVRASRPDIHPQAGERPREAADG
ncbi:branched-chain amino acid ABC transporter permease [Streptosporangium sp. NPDC006007]|uniref:branched-chain amino acid ABC transporter permease n=1 Tax=Streptosporangium sp. NPDC006007 TaxID=3154575 RepID=UPI0033A23C7C